jgi:hypothetical protein
MKNCDKLIFSSLLNMPKIQHQKNVNHQKNFLPYCLNHLVLSKRFKLPPNFSAISVQQLFENDDILFKLHQNFTHYYIPTFSTSSAIQDCSKSVRIEANKHKRAAGKFHKQTKILLFFVFESTNYDTAVVFETTESIRVHINRAVFVEIFDQVFGTLVFFFCLSEIGGFGRETKNGKKSEI